MTHKNNLNRWTIWWQWLLANCVAATLPALILQGEDYSRDRFFVSIVLIGAAQWLVLRQILVGLQLWPIVNCLGWGLGLSSGFLYFVAADNLPLSVKRLGKAYIPGMHDEDYIAPLIFLGMPVVIGLIVGFVQMLFLKSKLAKSGWWILASAIAFFLAIAALLLIGDLLKSYPAAVAWLGAWQETLGYTLAAAVYAIVTGTFLVCLVGHSGTKNSS